MVHPACIHLPYDGIVRRREIETAGERSKRRLGVGVDQTKCIERRTQVGQDTSRASPVIRSIEKRADLPNEHLNRFRSVHFDGHIASVVTRRILSADQISADLIGLIGCQNDPGREGQRGSCSIGIVVPAYPESESSQCGGRNGSVT